METLPGIELNLNTTLGAAFIGNIVSAIFYGITSIQTHRYFSRSKGDSLLLKYLVFILWLLDSLQLALVSHAVYTYTVTDFANPVAVLELPWSVVSQIIVTALSDVLVRCIFSYRLWRCETSYNTSSIVERENKTFFSVELHMWVVFSIIFSSTLVAFGGSLAFAIKAFGLASFLQIPTISWVLYTSFISGVVADVAIAASLFVLLNKHRTGFTRTDSMVRILMIYSVETGALTSLGAILCLVTYATMPNNFIFIAFYFLLPKLFLNSLLATLNARRTIRETSMGVVSIPSTVGKSFGNVRRGTSDLRELEEQGLGIQIHTSTDTKTDNVPQVPEGDPWAIPHFRDSLAGPYGVAM